jgi:hypothetical protein
VTCPEIVCVWKTSGEKCREPLDGFEHLSTGGLTDQRDTSHAATNQQFINNSLTGASGEVECDVINDSRRIQNEFEADAQPVAAQGSLFGDGRLKI